MINLTKDPRPTWEWRVCHNPACGVAYETNGYAACESCTPTFGDELMVYYAIVKVLGHTSHHYSDLDAAYALLGKRDAMRAATADYPWADPSSPDRDFVWTHSRWAMGGGHAS